jgi:WD repeat-containing protein 35
MLVYLSKKIAIPNDVPLRCVAWHGTRGYIACGGVDGMLKVLKLEPQEDAEGQLKGLAAPTALTMNQTLEGHDSSVQVVTWNETHHRLTSSDSNGHIVVWILYKGVWYEEMINNRNRSTVRDMQWNKDGQKICIAYEDGAVIVGSVDGNRIWSKDIKGVQLVQVAWSPDSKVILFGTGIGEVHIYDSHGSYNSKVNIQCLAGATGAVKLTSIEWYSGINGYAAPNCASLVVAFDNGRAQLMKSELDESPILMDVGMIQVFQVKWNHVGSLLAFAGRQQKDVSVVQFYNTLGEHLHTLKGPGKAPLSVAWEGNGLRLALGVAQYIYFANIRHNYKWGYFSGTVVYTFRKPEKLEHCLVFWSTTDGEKHAKAVKNLLHVTACRDLALLAAEVDDNPGEYVLLLCNALGTPLESKYINMEPRFVAISHTHVVAASSSAIFVWHYRTASRLAVSELTHLSRKGWEGQERLIHVDELPAEVLDGAIDFSIAARETNDQICSVGVSNQRLIVGRESGSLQYYSLPSVSLDGSVLHGSKPEHLAFNCTSTKFSVIDSMGFLNLYELDVHSGAQAAAVATQLELQRKEVWHLVWAEDNPDLFAMMEKTRMYIFRGVEPEEPIQSSAHICRFTEMTVKSVLMDEIMQDPENPSIQDHLLDLDIKSLRDTRSLLKSVGLKDTCQFIEDNPHPRLWKLLAEASLEQLELELAEKAFVKCKDFAGIQFVKKLHHLDSEVKQRAQVATYFEKFDEAERLYLELDCQNLAVDLRVKLGDWFKVVSLLKKGGGAAGDDALLTNTWNTIGDHYYDRQQWARAANYYTQGHNSERLAECYYSLEEYDRLEQLADSLPENNPLLTKLATMFVTVGMCDQAVKAFTKVIT